MQISRRVQPTQNNYSRSWEWKQGDKNPKNEPIEKLSLFLIKTLKLQMDFRFELTTRLTISALELINAFKIQKSYKTRPIRDS
jgi:hypothetical protein